MREAFITKRFSTDSLEVIDQANEIIDEYLSEGYSLSLRQLYYQFVSRDFIPNTQRSYKRLGNIVSDGRLAGMIDWNSVEDRTRTIERNNHWDSPSELLSAAVEQYSIDRWKGADYYVEVWVEKDALIEIVTQVTSALDCVGFACKGYVSQSAMYRASKRFIHHWRDLGKDCILLHLGDHDPSGIDMTRDISSRLDVFGSTVNVQRIALNMEQIEQYNPPPNPAKTTDSRYASYIQEYGDESWELDALDPRVISDLISDGIAEYIDMDLFERRREKEDSDREKMEELIDQLDEDDDEDDE